MMFWFAIACLCLVAALFVLAPLVLPSAAAAPPGGRDELNLSLYRERVAGLEEEGDGAASLELEAKKELLADTGPADGAAAAGGARPGGVRAVAAAAALVPVLALATYVDAGLDRGAWPDLRIAEALKRLDPHDGAAYRDFAERVRQRLLRRPEDPELRFIAAEVEGALGNHGTAAALYAGLAEDFPQDARLASRHARALFAVDGGRLTPRAREAVERALSLEPADLAMLELRAKEPAGALPWFTRALDTGVAGPRAARIRAAMAGVQARADGARKAGEAGARAIEVTVRAGPEVRLPPASAVFVFARAVRGPPMPLAVRRLTLGRLPATVRLDEGDAMMPGMSLAGFDEVVVVARVSASGSVEPAPGDYEARSGVIGLGGADEASVELVISERIR